MNARTQVLHVPSNAQRPVSRIVGAQVVRFVKAANDGGFFAGTARNGLLTRLFANASARARIGVV